MPLHRQIEPGSREAPIVGPSDSSDGAIEDPNREGTDRNGTGERTTIETEEVPEAADIGVDRIVEAQEAGLGGGLDQAEEAQLGITDEELERLADDT